MASAEATGVDVIVPLRNEAAKIPGFLAMLRAQTLRPARVIVADGMSTDGSRVLLEAARTATPGLEVVDNPAGIVPAALNVCLGRVRSPIVARMDTHAEYDPGYLEAIVGVLRERPEVTGVGGAMETAGRGAWGRAIASTLRRSFGLGGARHRVGGEAGPIPHVFSGCYRTDSLRRIGGWDERFHANEDFEADTRLREQGYVLWLTPDANSTWFVRESPRALALQMWRYGFYKSLTLRLHPQSLEARQLAPPTVVLLLVAALVLNPRKGLAITLGYVSVAGALGASAALTDGSPPLKGAVVPVIVHLAWGSGLLTGLVRFAIEPLVTSSLKDGMKAHDR